MKAVRIGFAMCGSFCTVSRALEQMQALRDLGYEIIPVMSENLYKTDTRFGKAEDIVRKAEVISGRKVLSTISDCEPIGPRGLTDIMVVAPCTGNTAAKLSAGIIDTSVTMAVKSHLRQKKPVLISIATNDALAAAAQNIGRLLNTRYYYFVPFTQDDPEKKPNSIVSDFSLIPQAAQAALDGIQLQPILC